MTTVSIQSTEQLSDVVRDASEKPLPIYPVAGQTQQHLLAPACEDGLTVDLSGLNQLIDYPHDDLTITVQAGMTMTQLQALLNAHHQTLPIDVPKASQATVGGSIAANINGPRRTGWGAWRDYVIGLSWVNNRGELAKAGGRVVKNVAGYDFCKLFTGSLGTLGLVTQVTLKVKPTPEKCSIVSALIKQDDLQAFAELIRFSRLRPSLFIAKMETASNCLVSLGFEDSAAAVDWQVAHLREIHRNVEHEVREGAGASQKITEWTEFSLAGESVTFEAHLPGSRCAEFALKTQQFPCRVLAQPAVGAMVGHLPADVTQENALKAVTALRGTAMKMGGYLTISRCPPGWRKELQPYGPTRADWELMCKVKRAMDPRNIFQRGRYEVLNMSGEAGKP